MNHHRLVNSQSVGKTLSKWKTLLIFDNESAFLAVISSWKLLTKLVLRGPNSATTPCKGLTLTKGSLHKKKPEIVWSFTKLGGAGGTPLPNYFRFFPVEKFYCLKMIYMLWNMKISNDIISLIMPSPHPSPSLGVCNIPTIVWIAFYGNSPDQDLLKKNII